MELKKLKISLSLSEEAEWMGYFNEQKAKAQALQAQIDRTDTEIDRLVYALYGLSDEEVGVVEGREVGEIFLIMCIIPRNCSW